MSKKNILPLIVLWLFCVIITHAPCFNHNNSTKFGVVQLLPERFRSFLSACLWEKADHLMHEGPVFEGQNFVAGSYAGNTDIVPLLKLIIFLSPDQTAPYRLLATNYAYHLNMGDEALELLSSAKENCANNKNSHEIYASEALIRLYLQRKSGKQDLKTVIALFDEAIKKYKTDEYFPDSAFTLENYLGVRESLQQKLDALSNTQNDESNVLSQKIQNNYSQKYNDEKEIALIENEEMRDQVQEHAHNHNHEHEYEHEHVQEHVENNNNNLNEENLLSMLIKLAIKAGLVAGLTVSCYFRG